MFIIQDIYKDSPEARAAILYGLTNNIKYNITTMENLTPCEITDRAELLNYIPIGSVEFVKSFAKVNDIQLVPCSSYPVELCKPWLNRELSHGKLGDIPDTFFVKPIKTKLFTGTIKVALSEEEVTKFNNDIVWTSPPVEFTTEWRVYVLEKNIIGVGQYDDGEMDVDITPYMSIVNDMIAAWKSQPIAFALDVGIIKGVGLSLVEVNDAWATGMYKGITQANYITWIVARWESIIYNNIEHRR